MKKFKRPIPHQIVEVLWLDSNSHEGWTEMETILVGDKLECLSVGYLLKKTRDYITLGPSLSLTDHNETGIRQVSGDITIPRNAIISYRIL